VLFQRSSASAAGRIVCLYGYGDHFAVLLLAGSTAFNFVAGRAIAEAVRRGEGTLGRMRTHFVVVAQSCCDDDLRFGATDAGPRADGLLTYVAG